MCLHIWIKRKETSLQWPITIKLQSDGFLRFVLANVGSLNITVVKYRDEATCAVDGEMLGGGQHILVDFIHFPVI